MMRTWKATLATVFAAAAFLAAPAAAPAAVTCDYSSQGQLLTVSLGAANDVALLSVVGNVLTVEGGAAPVTCTGPGGPPTTTNTGAISVIGDAVNQAAVIVGADEFVPGPPGQTGSDGGGATTEIEIFVNLNSRPGSTLVVDSGDDAGWIAIGSDGINPNLMGEVIPDADIIPVAVQSIVWSGSEEDDELLGQGGHGTGSPPSFGLSLSGRGGSDFIQGGQGPDGMRGGAGADALFGLGGDDVIGPDGGDDIADGGPGNDTLILSPMGPATVDLAVTGPQDTGDGLDTLAGFENAAAGDGGGATLRGDSGANRLTGSFFADTLEGRGGVDELEGFEGDDLLDVRDGGPDTADCGAGTDTVIADAPGIDTLVECETVLHPSVTRPPPGPPSPGPSAPDPDPQPPTIRSLRLAPAAFTSRARGPSARRAPRRRPRRGAIVTFAIDRLATVTYRVVRLLPGRRAGRRCVAPTKRNRGRPRCKRRRLVRGSFGRSARAGRNRFLFTGRIAGRRLAPGSYRLQAAPRAEGVTGGIASTPFRVMAPP